MTPWEAELAMARAAYDPDLALVAQDHLVADAAPLESPLGVPAPERHKEYALTLAVEVEPPRPFRRWRFFLFYCLVKLAAWTYPFKFEIYRTREPWE